MTILDEAHEYLYRYGTITDTTVDQIDLIRELTAALESLTPMIPIKVVVKKPKARRKTKKESP